MSNILVTHRGELLRALRDFKFERAGAGLYFTKQKVHIGGIFDVEPRLPNGKLFQPRQIAPNLVVNQALSDLLTTYLAQGSQITEFFIAPFTGDVTPQASWTGANFHTNATEWIGYSETGRQPWVPGDEASQQIDNTGSPAVFTVSGAPATLRGCGLLSSATRNGSAGLLFSAARFPNDIIGLPIGSTAGVKYVFQAADDGV